MSGKRKKGVKGLRDLATLLTLVHGVGPRDRLHLVSRFARLETERARLERELDMWNIRKQAAEDKLAKVKASLAQLRSVLLNSEHPQHLPRHRGGTGKLHRSRASTEVAGPAPPRSRAIFLEY
ncbi:MAG: hypothetical protein GWO40_02805 [Gammaproteobacteria bacterium]|nr:hypothetical protein [Desulfuromonadales bacterium]NIU03228.1 hypothetical protein [Gammaproteobacteria bacterium]NIX84503.1 hypothetical protein [Gammaproteobacteria bacterium]